MKLKIKHQTKYEYDRPVYLTPHLLRFKPAAHYKAPVHDFSLVVIPASHILHWQQDVFNNFVARVDFNGPLNLLQIDAAITITATSVNPFDFFVDEGAQYFPFEYEPQLRQDLSAYLHVTESGYEVTKWLGQVNKTRQEIVSFLLMLNQQVNRSLRYNIRMEPGVQSSETTLISGTGTCRDYGWLLVQLLRNLGLAARFVSGYIIQLAEANLPGNNEVATDTVDLHAWAEVYIPGAGWIGLDATSGLLAGGHTHIPIACTPSPGSAAPVTGTSEKAGTIFTTISTVTRM